ncbi:MAG: hypothetical protein OER77_01710 [Myxococcales bacterium]|nr:hypothetical protein [Myxococcales bacterium]
MSSERHLSVHAASDKRRSLPELAAEVRDGDTVGLGGGLSSREPMALLRELIRQGRRDLRVVGSAHGIDVDMLCGAGAVSVSAQSYVGFEQDFGMAPNYRRTCQSGEVRIDDGCCYTLVQQLRATILGVPFLPVRSVRGTDFETLHSFRMMTCPYTGEELALVPALRPDVSVLHAQYGDERGNLRIEGPPVVDILLAKSSRTVLATVEQLVSTEELHERGGATIPYFYVSAVSEVAFGAHPTACYPFYAYDRPHTAMYYRSAKAGSEVFRAEYLQPFVYDCPHHDQYLERVGGEALRQRLASWKDGPEAWQRLYANDGEVA